LFYLTQLSIKKTIAAFIRDLVEFWENDTDYPNFFAAVKELLPALSQLLDLQDADIFKSSLLAIEEFAASRTCSRDVAESGVIPKVAKNIKN
jgi:hypothetical protein